MSFQQPATPKTDAVVKRLLLVQDRVTIRRALALTLANLVGYMAANGETDEVIAQTIGYIANS